MSFFRESNWDGLPQPDTSLKPEKKKKKKKSSKSDWTWKDQVELVKWTDRMIDNSLMRMEHMEMNKVQVLHLIIWLQSCIHFEAIKLHVDQIILS